MKNLKFDILRLLIVVVLVVPQIVNGQAWQKNYFGDSNYADVVSTPDGGFVATRAGSAPIFKVDGDGGLLWEHTMPSIYENSYGQSIEVLVDGSTVAVGQTYITTPVYQPYVFIVKLDASGTVLWEQFHSISSGSGPFLIAAIPGGDDFLIGGQYSFLMKADENGDVIWQNNSVGMRGLVATADGGAFILVNDNTTASDFLFVRRVDALGLQVWNQAYIGNSDLVGRQMTATTDGGIAITGFDYNGGNSDYFLLKIGADGAQDFLTHFSGNSTDVGRGIDQTQDGGYLVTGWTYLSGRTTSLVKLDDQGNVVWEEVYGSGEGISVKELSDGIIIMATRGVRLFHLNSDGSIFQNVIKGNVAEDLNADCSLQTGEPGLEGWTVYAKGALNLFAKTDVNGDFEIKVDTGTYVVETNIPNFEWQPCVPTTTTTLSIAPDTNDIGSLMMEAVAATMTTISGYVYHDLDGDCQQGPGEPGIDNCVIWAADEPNFGTPQYMVTTDANGFYSFTFPAGEYYWVGLPNPANNPICTPCDDEFFQYVTIPVTNNIGMDCQGAPPQHISGFVFYDENSNCMLDFGENPISGWEIDVVEIGGTDTLTFEDNYLNTGEFTVSLDTGTYYFVITPPNYLFYPCQTVQVVQVTPNGTAPVMFPLMPFASCPKMSVDVGTAFLRPCMESTYHVKYCNEGTATAEGAYVEISLPVDLVLGSSELPATDLSNNVWSFDLGDMQPGECSDFWFKATLDCDSEVGLTHCVEAHIYPDSLCTEPAAEWDGSSIELTADCVGDSVILTILNNGWGDMLGPLEFIVVEDNVLIKDSLFQLESGNSTNVVVYPNGATILLQAQQSLGHPGNSFPVVFVEGCSGDSISIGFVTQYPQDDADCFVDIDCRESVNSYDPNKKEAQPKGVTDAHFITAETSLDYQITFQNLGTAPAIDVEILDTLSQMLDTATLRVGVASHAYDWELLDGNILKFTFENINLPHAAADSLESIGFVKYHIEQKTGNTPNTVIENRAGIYFDFNDPVMTNTVVHRIPEPQMYATQTVTLCAGAEYNGQVFDSNAEWADTVHYAFFDSIFITEIIVLPVSETQIQDGICEGEAYEFNDDILTAGGTYVASLIDQNGCDSLVTLNLEEYPDQSTSVDTMIQSGAEILGIPVFSDTTIVQDLLDANGCDYTLAINVSILVSSFEEQFEPILKISPNPNDGSFMLTGELQEAGRYSAAIYNVFGQLVKNLFVDHYLSQEFRREVNLGAIESGTYYVLVANENMNKTLKVIIVK